MFLNKEHTLYVEKYRPTGLETFAGNGDIKSKFAEYIKMQDLPAHLLLYGTPGTGKTTLAKIIVKNIKCDYLYINASDENNIDTVRTKIKNFASSMGMNPLKVIILDEADYLTPPAQAALRNLMETYSRTCKFILTCNYHEKIIDPLHSRCQTFEVIPPNKSEVAVLLVNILKKEEVQFNKEVIALLINKYFPDIRKIIGTAQKQIIDGRLQLTESHLIENDFKTKIGDILADTTVNKKNAFLQIRQLIADNQVRDYNSVIKFLYDKVDAYGKGEVGNIILTLAEGQYQDALVVDKEINFMAIIVRILDIIKK